MLHMVSPILVSLEMTSMLNPKETVKSFIIKQLNEILCSH